MAVLEFHFDFGSPNAYMAHKVLPNIEQRNDVTFDYIPVLLGGVFKATNNVSPATNTRVVANKPEYQQLEMQRFLRKHQIEFNFNPDFPINTLQIMRGAVAAKFDGAETFKTYVDAVFDAMWCTPKKMDDPAVIEWTLETMDLDVERLSATPEVKQQLIRNTEDSVARGTFGSPSFFVGEELFFGKDRLVDVEEQIIYQKLVVAS
ncbi:MAG: 2-hydroxychromene-2-carboxylate isomerase [Gammaproteobacteria bacterium]|nr:2-hydroxychromene-2-carboxylate isomerase [Gammaproteobacteria bacterium]